MTNKKVKLPITGAVLLAALISLYMTGTPESIEPPAEITEIVETIDITKPSVELTEEQYQTLKRKLREKIERGEISTLDYLYGDSPEMRLYRAIVNEEKTRVEGNLNQKNIVQEIIKEVTK